MFNLGNLIENQMITPKPKNISTTDWLIYDLHWNNGVAISIRYTDDGYLYVCIVYVTQFWWLSNWSFQNVKIIYLFAVKL